MALFEISGISSHSSFRKNEENDFEKETFASLSKLGSPGQLALPPLGCVSISFYFDICLSLQVTTLFLFPNLLFYQPTKFSSQPVDEHGRPIKINFDHGTTTLGFKYQGGIVLAVDSRATGGQYIGNTGFKKKLSKKIN